MKKISVCIATYNGELYIKEQIESILHQTIPVDEIIVSDNCSTDNTLNILKDIKDKRIKIYSYTNKKRVALNFENALLKSTGDIIFLSDQDDRWFSNKIEESLKELEENDLIVHDADLFEGKSFFSLNGIRKGLVSNIYKSSFLGCCMGFKREMLDRILPFPKGFDTDIKPKMHGHDTWIGIVSLYNGKVKFLKKKLIYYRRHDGAVSESGYKSKRSILEKIGWRFFLVTELFKRNIYDK